MPSTRGNSKDLTKGSSLHVAKGTWAHTPSTLTLAWLFISLPLIVWDASYVLLRPHSMPGGALHWPLWVPYELYGKVDYIYGWKAFNEHNGFTAAQSVLNAVETLCYLYYLYAVFVYGGQLVAPSRGSSKPATRRSVNGPMAGVAVLVVFSAALMTLSKTVLYWLNEYFSGFENIGHNNIQDLVLLWIIPNGAWLLLPSYMIYVCGSDILQGLAIAAGGATPSSEDRSSIKTE